MDKINTLNLEGIITNVQKLYTNNLDMCYNYVIQLAKSTDDIQQILRLNKYGNLYVPGLFDCAIEYVKNRVRNDEEISLDDLNVILKELNVKPQYSLKNIFNKISTKLSI